MGQVNEFYSWVKVYILILILLLPKSVKNIYFYTMGEVKKELQIWSPLPLGVNNLKGTLNPQDI